MNGPRRIQIQRQYTGPAPTIGAAPTSSPEPTDARYVATKLAKQAMDRATVARQEAQYAAEGRERYAGPMGQRRGSQVAGGGGSGGGSGGAGTAAPAPFMAAGSWWQNPWLWGAAIAVYFYTRRGK